MAPADQTSALVQGTLDMLILKTLALEPMHGYGIGMRLEQISHGTFQVNAGSPKRRGNGRHRLRRSRASCARPRISLMSLGCIARVLWRRRRPRLRYRIATRRRRDRRHNEKDLRTPARRSATIEPMPVLRNE